MRAVGGFCIPDDHPSLPGHFPGRPIVPGVVLLDAAFALILAQHPGRSVTGVPSVKFTHPVRPGEHVSVLLGALRNRTCDLRGPRSSCGDGAERAAFACAVGGQDVLRGVLTLGERR